MAEGPAIDLETAMYAVIASGGKQEKVAQGETVQVELLGVANGEEVRFEPVLLVDGDTVLATPEQLKGATVVGRVVGIAGGPKIDGFTYKRRTNQRRRYGHRQKYSVVEITSIAKG
jgi:large subunit ribosomal protein L21